MKIDNQFELDKTENIQVVFKIRKYSTKSTSSKVHCTNPNMIENIVDFVQRIPKYQCHDVRFEVKSSILVKKIKSEISLIEDTSNIF